MSVWVIMCLRGSKVVIAEVCYFDVGDVVLSVVVQKIECQRHREDHRHPWLLQP